jgi:hypothetical protein
VPLLAQICWGMTAAAAVTMAAVMRRSEAAVYFSSICIHVLWQVLCATCPLDFS